MQVRLGSAHKLGLVCKLVFSSHSRHVRGVNRTVSARASDLSKKIIRRSYKKIELKSKNLFFGQKKWSFRQQRFDRLTECGPAFRNGGGGLLTLNTEANFQKPVAETAILVNK